MVAPKWFCAAIALALLSTLHTTHASITSSMLVEMNDLTSVSRSPDGRTVVVGMCHPNTRSNARELYWVIVRLGDASKPMYLPAGAEILDPMAPGALLNVPVQWSPDGRWFFYLRRDGEQVQLWKTSTDGKKTEQLTHSPEDILGLKASLDVNSFNLQLAPNRQMLRKSEEREDLTGVLYDDHVLGGFPISRTFPIIDRWRNVRHTTSGDYVPPGWDGMKTAVFDIHRRTLTLESSKTPLAASKPLGDTDTKKAYAVPVDEMTADSYDYPGQYTLEVTSKLAEDVSKCSLPECMANRITVIGWSRNDEEVYYVAESLGGRLGNQKPGQAALYAWNPQRNAVRLIYKGSGRLYDVDEENSLKITSPPLRGGDVVFIAADADEPPRVQSIDLQSGAVRIVFDPNAGVRSVSHGRAAWYTWPTTSGYPGRGVRYLPDDFEQGRRYPLLITSYGCGEGFLRGGGSDNAPELVAAHFGFVVICIDIPVREIMSREKDYSRIFPVMCSLIDELIADQVASGMVDGSRVGLSGHSLGANAGSYCLAHPNKIAAAAFRNGSVLERARWDLFDTAAWRRDPVNGVYALFHMPDPENDPTGRWDQMSVVNKAARISTPLLIQVSDTEYLGALPLWSALHQEHKAVEMYVFPRETHRLIQPAHQLINFERQIDWFRFWLKNERDEDPAKSAQYARWTELKASTEHTGS